MRDYVSLNRVIPCTSRASAETRTEDWPTGHEVKGKSIKSRGQGRRLRRKLHLVNIVVMIKIEEGYKLFFFVYFIDQEKRTANVNTAFILHRPSQRFKTVRIGQNVIDLLFDQPEHLFVF